ncbi:MAG: hypothetical protein HEP71_32520 [Roseivirga sp.]|nr:hypothetical protein [Roseivirga sp.]
MHSKTRFQLSIVVLTVVLIGALTGAFMSGMFLFLDEFSVSLVLVMLICLGLASWCLFKMIQLNRTEVKSRIGDAVDDYHEFMDKWTIESVQWKEFLRARLDFDKGESKGYGYALGGMLTFLVALIGFARLEIQLLIPVLIGIFLLFFALGKWGALVNARSKFKRQLAFDEGQVHFAEKLVVLNGQLIMLEDFGVSLKAFQAEERFGMKVLLFKVETGYANRKSHSQFFIPVPAGKEESAERLVNHYSALMAGL